MNPPVKAGTMVTLPAVRTRESVETDWFGGKAKNGARLRDVVLVDADAPRRRNAGAVSDSEAVEVLALASKRICVGAVRARLVALVLALASNGICVVAVSARDAVLVLALVASGSVTGPTSTR